MKGRLDGCLSQAGLGSRRETRDLVRSGRVTVSGVVVRDPAFAVAPDRDEVAVDGHSLAPPRHRHLALHKPAGVVTAAADRHHGTVLDLVPPAWRHRDLQPVGRLDRDTTGLLLLTTDGLLLHRLISPRWHVPKTYRVGLDRPLPPLAAERLRTGVVLADGTCCRSAEVAPGGGECELLLTLTEGRYHQVKRMVAAVGGRVLALHRERFGPVGLKVGLNGDAPPGAGPELTPGRVRELTPVEVTALYQAAELGTGPG